MTEIQRVLAAIDANPGMSVEELAERTGLGPLVVVLIVDELEHRRIVYEDDDRYGVTRFGDEVMSTRANAEAG